MMRKMSIPRPIQTLFVLCLSIIGTGFNTSPLWGKCTASAEIHAGKMTAHPTAFRFGQARLSHARAQNVASLSDFRQLMSRRRAAGPLSTLVIDPGHGGHDDGTTAPDGTKEKDVALAIARRLGDYVRHYYPEVELIYTRTTDEYIPLKTRARIANQSKADLFISIHCNSFSKASVRGTETFVMGDERADENLEIIKRENGGEDGGYSQFISAVGKRPEAYQREQMEKSLSFATKVEGEFVQNGRTSRGVKEAGFLVLRRTVMPSVLVETGYLSNDGEMRYLVSPKGQEEVAYQIYTAFAEYKEEEDAPFGGSGKYRYMPVPPLLPCGPAVVLNQPSRAEGIRFGVHLLSSDGPVVMKGKKWKSVRKRVETETWEDGTVHYVVKDHGQDYAKAEKELKKLKKKGFDRAFVTAYDADGKVMAVFMAKKRLGLD